MLKSTRKAAILDPKSIVMVPLIAEGKLTQTPAHERRTVSYKVSGGSLGNRAKRWALRAQLLGRHGNCVYFLMSGLGNFGFSVRPGSSDLIPEIVAHHSVHSGEGMGRALMVCVSH